MQTAGFISPVKSSLAGRGETAVYWSPILPRVRVRVRIRGRVKVRVTVVVRVRDRVRVRVRVRLGLGDQYTVIIPLGVILDRMCPFDKVTTF